MGRESELVRLATYPSRLAAELAARRLESAGIPVSVTTDEQGGAEPRVGLTGGTKLRVAPEDLQQAREVLVAANATVASLEPPGG